MDILLIVLLFILGLEVGTTLLAAGLNKIMELKIMKSLFDNGQKHIDDNGLNSKLIIDYGVYLYVPVCNVMLVSGLFANFERTKERFIGSVDDEIYPLSPLEQEIYNESPTYLTIMRLPKLVYSRLKGMPISRMTNLANGSETYFKRLKDGDVSIVHSLGPDSRMGVVALRNRVLGESEVINEEIARKYSSIDEFIKDSREGMIDLEAKEDISSFNGNDEMENQKDYLHALREDLISRKEEDLAKEQSMESRSYEGSKRFINRRK